LVGARRIVLRPLTEGESSTLEQRLREKRLPAKIYERDRIIDLVRDGMTPAAASRAVGCSDGKAEHWVHRFNDSGFTSAPCSPADHSSGTLVGHCHDRNRSFDLSPSLAALVRT
jgi:transposase